MRLFLKGTPQSDLKSTIKEQNETSPIICGSTCMTIFSVRVSDKNGKKTTDLRWTDFTIYENGVTQEIYDFRRVESSEKKGSQAVYKLGYVPMDEYVDGLRIFMPLTVVDCQEIFCPLSC